MLFLTLAMITVAYLMGSVSSAIIICRLLKLPDPRTKGSGNPGATNVLRIGGKLPAIAVLAFDILKGTIPVWSAYFLGIDPVYLGLIAIAACLGHMFPIFFDFKGGKAVASAFGALLPIGLDLGALLVITWFSVAKLSKYSSLAAICAVCLAPFYTWLLKPVYTYPVLMLSALILFRHRQNMVRLIQGTEPKITDKKLS